MELIRRDTDYAMRLAARLAREYAKGGAVSARLMSTEHKVPYPLTCKLLQRLTHAGFVESEMGAKGGFRLARRPETIKVSDVVEAIQGPICVNKCSDGSYKCPVKCSCGMHPKMIELQNQIHEYLYSLNLGEFVKENKNDQ
jgi:Rrf2 family transcriptional regulator, iron-sulfur cluster assembly transcription factor